MAIVKKITIFGIYLTSILLGIEQSYLFSTPFSEPITLPDKFQTNENVGYSEGSYRALKRNDAEKMMYTQIKLKKNQDYLIRFDTDVEVYYYEPTELHIDLWAPIQGYDLPEQEVVFHLDKKTGHKIITAKINSKDIPEPTLFRIFHYTPNRVAISNIQLREMTAIGWYSKYALYALILVVTGVYLLKGSLFIHHSIKSGCTLNPLNLFHFSERTGYHVFSLVAIYLFFVIVRFSASLLFQTPLIATDELAYKNMALSYFRTGSFYNTEQLGLAAHVPNVLYQWIISSAFLFGNNFYIVVKMINAIVMNSVVFPIFFLLKNFVSPRKAILGGVLVLLIASMNYVNFLMVESLYLVLYIGTFSLIYKSLVSRSSFYSIAAGLFLSLLLLTKINAVALLISYIVTCLIIFWIPDSKERKRYTVLESLIYTLITFLFSYSLLSIMLKGEISFSIGSYNNLIKSEVNREILSIGFWTMVAGHGATFLFQYFIPLGVMVLALVRSIRMKISSETTLLLLILTNAVFLFAMVLKFSADIAQFEHFQRLHARYYFVIYPLCISAFLIFSEKLNLNFSRKILYLLLYAIVVVATGSYFLPKFASNALVIIDYPEFAWYRHVRPYTAVLWGLMGFSILSMALYLFAKRYNNAIYILFFIVMAVVTNIGEILGSSHADRINSHRTGKYIKLIQGHLPNLNSSVVMIEPGNDYHLHVAFWCPYDYERVYLFSEGQRLTRGTIPYTTQYLVLFGKYKIDLDCKVESIYQDNVLSIFSLS